MHVGIWLWHWHFIKRSPKIGLSVKKLESFGVERHSAYRALKALEQAKLVSVDRHAGRSPLVTLRAIE
ncbi:MAG: hypothetical protein O2954_06850 [bacterium]|nr:hypothetical protein [bacterium]